MAVWFSCENCRGSAARMSAWSVLSITTWTLRRWNQKRKLASINTSNSSMPTLAPSFITSSSALAVLLLFCIAISLSSPVLTVVVSAKLQEILAAEFPVTCQVRELAL